MQDSGGPDAIVEKARKFGIQAGEQRAYIMARVLQDVTVIFAGVEYEDVVRKLGCIPASSVEEALAKAQEIVGEAATVLVVPHALLTLPIVG
jgi:nickel-dependent lactate racemase